MSLKQQIKALGNVSAARLMRAEQVLAQAKEARRIAEKACQAADTAVAAAVAEERTKRAELLEKFVDHPCRMVRVDEVMSRFKGYRARVTQAESDRVRAEQALKDAAEAIEAAQSAVLAAKQVRDKRALAFDGHLAALDRARDQRADDRQQEEYTSYAALKR